MHVDLLLRGNTAGKAKLYRRGALLPPGKEQAPPGCWKSPSCHKALWQRFPSQYLDFLHFTCPKDLLHFCQTSTLCHVLFIIAVVPKRMHFGTEPPEIAFRQGWYYINIKRINKLLLGPSWTLRGQMSSNNLLAPENQHGFFFPPLRNYLQHKIHQVSNCVLIK